MNELQAREILGVSVTATFKEIKKAHRGLVNIFHPDRAARDVESQRKATDSMSRINLAWSIIEERQNSGVLGKEDAYSNSSAASSSWQFNPRRPGKNECGICGSAPAEFLTIKGVVVLLIGIGWPGYQGILCKSCAKAFARDALRTTMMRGWWGVWFFLTPFFIAYLVITLGKISRMKEPTYRDFRVVTPYDMPVSSRPNPFKDLKALGAMSGGIIAVVVVLIISGNSSSPTSGGGSQSTPVSLNCWTAANTNGQLRNVDCSDTQAVYQTLITTFDSASCPPSTVVELDKDANGMYTCLGLKS